MYYFLDMARNVTISPDKDTFYHGETMYVLVEANPAPNQIKWTHLNTSTVSTFKLFMSKLWNWGFVLDVRKNQLHSVHIKKKQKKNNVSQFSVGMRAESLKETKTATFLIYHHVAINKNLLKFVIKPVKSTALIISA